MLRINYPAGLCDRIVRVFTIQFPTETVPSFGIRGKLTIEYYLCSCVAAPEAIKCEQGCGTHYSEYLFVRDHASIGKEGLLLA